MPDEPIPTLGRKTYVVVGPHEVHGTKNGETVELDLTAEQEAFYVNGGHLAVAKTGKKAKEG